jgi:hypothetical protein
MLRKQGGFNPGLGLLAPPDDAPGDIFAHRCEGAPAKRSGVGEIELTRGKTCSRAALAVEYREAMGAQALKVITNIV